MRIDSGCSVTLLEPIKSCSVFLYISATMTGLNHIVIVLEVSLSAKSCGRFIGGLLSAFGFEGDQFSFNIIAEESDEADEDDE